MHIDGKNNPGGDGVSRLPTEASVFSEKEVFYGIIRLPTEVSTFYEKEIFSKQKIYKVDDSFTLDLNHIKNQQDSDQQDSDQHLKKINKNKLDNKIVR